MPPISPTTLLVAGSMSITLSPAALVCTMRTAAACSVAAAARHPSTTESLVRMEEHFRLSGHVADPVFPARAADRRPDAAVDARLRRVQGQSAAAPPRETARPRAVLRVPLHRHGVPAAAA